MRYRDLRGVLAASAAVCAVVMATPAVAQTRTFDVPAQSAATGIPAVAAQAEVQILVSAAAVRGKSIRALKGAMTVDQAIRRIAADAGLRVVSSDDSTYALAPAPAPAPNPSASAAPAAEPLRQEVIIVTAQKREESIQDVPIAVTAISSEGLEEYKIESGAELLRAVPNVNFSKTNFSMYNFSIRGIGTKSISASSDPAVAVSFNNTPLIRNRLFEAEFFDMARIEVLRGPQGTLYGRNATAGVVNLIPALPESEFGGQIRGEVGSYATRRLTGHLNLPLGETFGVRLAGMMTKRDGYDYNTVTGNDVNGRDLWSTRAIAQWEPSASFSANLIWQHFEEDDDRSRTGKQLCKRDPGPTSVGSAEIDYVLLRGKLSQGCLPGSIYSDEAFGAPNLSASSQYLAAIALTNLGFDRENNRVVSAVRSEYEPYADIMQSRDLREIATSYDPVFRAKNDVVQLNLEADIGAVKLVSQTAYSRDRYYSSQDYNRFVSAPIFTDSTSPSITDPFGRPPTIPGPTPGGIYTDPQLGPSDRWQSVDLSMSRNRQWSQELRLQSDFDGNFNFNVGANYLDFKTQDDYYVFSNIFTLVAEYAFNRISIPGEVGASTRNCENPFEEMRECIYVDPNPLGSINSEGHNYFLSRNLVRTKSWGLFGEAYWDVTDDLKVTAGLRYTLDRKITTPVPSQLLLGAANMQQNIGSSTGGRTSRGYRELPDVEQKWDALTGRLVVDWSPATSFSDDTLVYASYSRGYKAGGSNPPFIDVDPSVIQFDPLPPGFEPEYINAFEIGTKNSFAGGRVTVNAAAFLNLYKDYQVSKIVDRISLNENFDATTWGFELEAAWRPSRNFRLDAMLGYLRTRIGDGEQSIDVMDRTQGNEDWVVVRPSLAVPTNCIAPREIVETIISSPLTSPPDGGLSALALGALCGGSTRWGSFNPDVETFLRWDTFYGVTYDPFTDAPNRGRGFAADLSGNELPNAPRWTMNLGAQYTFFFEDDDWELTFRGDYYRQAKSYARVYNTKYDRLKAWDNLNLAVSLERPESQLAFQLYVKNAFNDTPITDFFTNSDDTGLTTNVFTLDPRIIGFSVTKGF